MTKNHARMTALGADLGDYRDWSPLRLWSHATRRSISPSSWALWKGGQSRDTVAVVVCDWRSVVNDILCYGLHHEDEGIAAASTREDVDIALLSSSKYNIIVTNDIQLVPSWPPAANARLLWPTLVWDMPEEGCRCGNAFWLALDGWEYPITGEG